MTTQWFRNVLHLSGKRKDIVVEGPDREIDGSHLLALPALIDPHVHFRVPGGEHKEDWKTASLAAISSGVTRVLEMPNNNPPATTLKRLAEKKKLIDAQLKAVDMPLRYGLYFGADKEQIDQIEQVGDEAVAIKVFMGCSTGGLVVDTDEALEEIFKKANKLIAVHAEDEELLAQKRKEFAGSSDPSDHSKMRPREAAVLAVQKAISLCEKYNQPLYILHMSTREELDLVRAAKKKGLPVYAETTTHHLFFTEEDYATWGTRVQMNPPLRTSDDQEALWEAIHDGTLDTIGTDHAPHTLEEKMLPFGQAPSGIPGVETLVPLLLNAVNEGRLTLERMVEMTRTKIEQMFDLPPNDDLVLVDMNYTQKVKNSQLLSKSGWTPYEGRELQGWPMYTIVEGRVIQSRVGAERKNAACVQGRLEKMPQEPCPAKS